MKHRSTRPALRRCGSGFPLAAPFLGRLAGNKGPPTDTHYARATAFSCDFEIEPGTESIPSAEFRNGKSVLFVSHMHLHTPKNCLDCPELARVKSNKTMTKIYVYFCH
jgi:hypothetical protein